MELQLEKPVNIRQEAIKNGLIMAGVNIVIFLVVNYVIPDLMGSIVLGVIQVVIGISIAVALILDMRKKIGGYWIFSQALLHIFVMFIISATIVYIFTILFGKFIDTTYPERMAALMTEKMQGMFESLGMDQDKIAEALEKQNAEMEKQFNPSFGQAVVGLGIQAAMYFVGALIFAAIFKRNPPVKLEEAE